MTSRRVRDDGLPIDTDSCSLLPIICVLALRPLHCSIMEYASAVDHARMEPVPSGRLMVGNHRFPSLSSIRAFEAAARLGSFAKAALELSGEAPIVMRCGLHPSIGICAA